jgi:hypothetical protein
MVIRSSGERFLKTLRFTTSHLITKEFLMRTPTPGLVLDYLPVAGGARLVRVYGDTPCVTLPEALPAAGGAPLPLCELGDYCFAETPRGLPPAETLLRCTVDEQGRPQMQSRALPGPGEATGAAPCERAPLHPIAGRFLEELTLPDALRVIGSCAFYNCRALRRLGVGAQPLTAGSDLFLNAFALHEFTVRAAPDTPTGLFALLGRITGAVRVVFLPEGEGAPRAALWYPEYWEDYEETPAHILLHTFSGQGYHYRQCFLNNIVLWGEYDAVFAQGHDADDPATMAQLCFDRLRYPYNLSDAAAEQYRAFLAQPGRPGRNETQNALLVLQAALAAQSTDAVRALLALDVMDEAALTAGAALAAKAEQPEAAALLTAAAHRRHADAQRAAKARYSFDF